MSLAITGPMIAAIHSKGPLGVCSGSRRRTAKPIPRWDVHFGGLEDCRKDYTSPHITSGPQLGGHRHCGLGICTFHLGFSLVLQRRVMRKHAQVFFFSYGPFIMGDSHSFVASFKIRPRVTLWDNSSL